MTTTDQMLAESRKKSMLQYVSEGATKADLEAAGYTPDEIAIVQPDKSIQPVKPTGVLESYTPTARDTLRENVRRGVSSLGVDDQTAQFYAGRMAGTGGDMGLVDVTGVGVIPGVQEGIQQAERGYKTGSKTEMAMGALGAGLGVLSAIPGGKLLAKGITKGAEKAVEKVLSREVVPEVAQATEATLAKEVAQTSPKSPYKPTMFRSNEAGKIEVNPNALMEFYSPTVETIRNVEFPAKGYKGSELLKFLKEKAPGVRKTEVDALDLKLDPQKRYTREEALAEVEKKAYKVYAEEVDDTIYKNQQRQDISDPEISFSTLKINATREGDTFMPSLGYTHYDPETIAHTRISIRENAQGKRYLLVEELQSDLVQAKGAKPRGALTRDEAYEEVINSTVKNLASKSPEKLAVYKNNKELYNSMFKLASEDARIRDLQFRGIDVPKEELDNLEKIRNKTISYQNKGGSDRQLLHDFESLGGDAGPTMDRRMKAITKAPLTEDADAVRLALQTAMAKADESDATSIVIPNLQRIVTTPGRGARYGTENYNKYMKAGSGFQKTYVDGVENFIAQLKKEYGDAIKVEQIELPYRSKTTFYSDAMSGRDVPLDNTALKIDFSGLKGVNLKSGQFAEGGLTAHVGERQGVKQRDISGDITFRGEGGSLTPSFSYSKTKSQEKYPDGVVVDSEGKHLGLALNGELFLDKEGQNKLRAGVARDMQSGSQEVTRLNELLDKGSYSDGSTRLSLGADLGKLSLDMVTDKNNTSGKAVYRLGKNAEISAEGSKGLEPRFGFNFSKQFAEGGTVEKEQMDKLMQEGGIAASGATQEPVTGNEVPPGAMPSEVRDNVPAQLSEGEYVVPADVVRFFGVKYFEDLRSQAKRGLEEMQSNGRIGGASVDSNGIPAEDDELTPEEEQMLQNALGKTGMADGGVVPFDRTTFTLDSPSTSEARKYIDPKTGEIKEFNFLYGAPLETIPANYVPWTQAIADAAANPVAPVAPAPTTPEPKHESWADSHPSTPTGGTDGGAGNHKWATENYDAITSDPAKFGMTSLEDDTGKYLSKGLTLAGAIAPAIAGPAVVGGAVVKAYNKIENIANANASLKIMEAQGKKDTPEYAALQAATKARIDALPTAQQALVENGLAGTGDRLFKQWQEEDAKRKGGTITSTGGTQGGSNSGTKGGTGGTQGGTGGGTGGTPPPKNPTRSDSEGGSGKSAGNGPSVSSATTVGGRTSAGTSNTNFTTSAPAPVGGNNNSTPKSTPVVSHAAATGHAKGGLVSKPKKTTPKTKGLAGK